MSNTSKATEANGYGLPEGTQRRLKKLQEYVAFLVQLTGPLQASEGPAYVHPAELRLCLDQLVKRVAPVIDALSQGVDRERDRAAAAPDAATEAHAGEGASESDAEATRIPTSPSGKRYMSGITLDQVDEINLLLESLRALGNVVYCADHAEYSKATLAIMGDAIYRDVDKLLDILNEIYDSQQLEPNDTRNSVREAPASYVVQPARSYTRSPSLHACEANVYH
jgi:hypothetical protein